MIDDLDQHVAAAATLQRAARLELGEPRVSLGKQAVERQPLREAAEDAALAIADQLGELEPDARRLVLALGAQPGGGGLRIESLFIDEGSGALDTASLGQAIAVLEQFHAGGRRVGVISHVEEVKERIPVKIEVTPVTRGRSTIAVVAG